MSKAKDQPPVRKVLQLTADEQRQLGRAWRPRTTKLPTAGPRVKFRARHQPGVMNKTEQRYAQHLEMQRRLGAVQEWQFEPCSIRLAQALHIRPDFLVILADGSMELVDVKGSARVIEDDSLAKLKMLADHWWFATVVIVWPEKTTGWHRRELPAGSPLTLAVTTEEG